MYWTRADSALGILPWLGMSALWWVGGTLICSHLFRLPSRERLVTGLGCGVLLFISVSNLASHLLSFPLALWTGASLVLGMGLLSAWGGRSFASLRMTGWPERITGLLTGQPGSSLRLLATKTWGGSVPYLLQLLSLAGLTVFFGLINRGLAIFDDYHNLPLISTMAAGDVPPHFYLNTGNLFAYHYGWHLFAASLVRVGNLFPWSAFDISKAFSLALMAFLAWSWFWRKTHSRPAAGLGVLLALLGGGARWLLLLAPRETLIGISKTIELQGTSAFSGPNLFTNISGPWVIEGGGPVPFPFAFSNGIFPPAIMALGGSGAIPLATLFLLLLLSGEGLARRNWTLGAAAVYSLLFASLGLTAEYLFVPLVVGLAGALLAGVLLPSISGRRTAAGAHSWIGWSAILIAGLALAFLSGGLLTEMLRRVLARLGGGPSIVGAGFIGLGLRWPPALVSAHLGGLSFSKPGQVLAGLAEAGSLLFLAPWAAWRAWKGWKRGHWLLAGTGLAALAGFLAPMFIQYLGRDRDITHMTGAALFLCMVLGYPCAWRIICCGRRVLRIALSGIFAVALFGGLILLGIQMLAIPQPQLTTFVEERDATISSFYWNRLSPGAQILDPRPPRAITLFGLGGGRAYQDFFMPLPEWQALLEDPDPVKIARYGYSYIYIDQKWWSTLSPQEREPFGKSCVRLVNSNTGKGVNMRRLLDIRDCK